VLTLACIVFARLAADAQTLLIKARPSRPRTCCARPSAAMSPATCSWSTTLP